jgi:hypothetical protein
LLKKKATGNLILFKTPMILNTNYPFLLEIILKGKIIIKTISGYLNLLIWQDPWIWL